MLSGQSVSILPITSAVAAALPWVAVPMAAAFQHIPQPPPPPPGAPSEFAFAEQDAPVIEAQQRVIETATRPLDPVILAVDVGPVHYKRVLNKMLQAEQP